MTPEEIDTLEALLKKTTPGVWIDMGDTEPYPGCIVVTGDGDPLTVVLRDAEMDDRPEDRACTAALHNAAPALIAAAREVERLRAFVPVWTPVGNPDGDWRLSLGARELARVCPCGGGRWYPSNAATLDFATIGEAAAAVCARLGIPSVEVGDV